VGGNKKLPQDSRIKKAGVLSWAKLTKPGVDEHHFGSPREKCVKQKEKKDEYSQPMST